MRFPLALTSKVAKYIVGNKLRGTKKFATVLQLEPLHTCNLTCTGCGRIREYSAPRSRTSCPWRTASARRPSAARRWCPSAAANRSFTRRSRRFPRTLLNEQKRVVYLCTNAMFMRRKMRAYMAREFGRTPEGGGADQARLVTEGLMTEKEAAEVRKGPKDAERPGDGPAPVLFLERASRRPGVHARPDRRARGRLQGGDPGHADGQDPRLPSLHEHDRLQGNRHEREWKACSISWRISASTATRSAPATSTTPPRPTWSSA